MLYIDYYQLFKYIYYFILISKKFANTNLELEKKIPEKKIK